jgi:hypothetical protein
MIATCPIKTNNQKAKLGKKEARSTRERDMAGEREGGGGAPEKEGGAARGRSGGAHGCDGGSKVIVRRSKRTIWSGSATAVGDCSGFPSLSFFNFFCTLVLIWEW